MSNQSNGPPFALAWKKSSFVLVDRESTSEAKGRVTDEVYKGRLQMTMLIQTSTAGDIVIAMYLKLPTFIFGHVCRMLSFRSGSKPVAVLGQ